ncbi:MAG: hypothetical protein LUO83_02675 [Methanothrix sp.]|nr:hypothetical protein [Methanothrix sp.]
MVSKRASSGKSTSILLHIELVYSRQDSVPLLLGVQGSAALILGSRYYDQHAHHRFQW